MSDKKKAPSDPAELRRRAEDKLNEKTSASTPSEEADDRKLLHELQVHQIELELQNEELRAAQQELETSRNRYADLYDFAPVGYCTLDDYGIILEANLTAATMLGVVRSQLVRKPITRFILKDDQDIYHRHRKDLLETGEPQSCELRMIKSNGSEFWVNLSATAAQDPDGAPGCRVVMSDITKRKQAEALLQEQSKFLETLLDSIPSPVFYKDRDGRYLGCNRSLEALLGKKRQEIIGKTVHEVWPDRYADTYREKDLEVIENPGKQQYESQLLSANGEERDTIFYKSTFANLDGSVGGIVGVMLDITERKRAETELARSEKKYRTLLEAAFDLIYVIGRDDTVLYVNPAGSKLLGKPPEEIISKPRASFFPPEAAANQKIALDRVFASGEPFYREQENLQNEHVQWQETQLIPLKNPDGSVESVLGISRDISERKQAEEQFRTIFTTSLDLICIASIETSTFTKINPAFSRLLGYTEAELLGKPFLEFIHPDDIESTQRVVKDQLRVGQTVFHFENRYRTVKGKYIWLDWTSHPKPEKGITFAIARDITDQKRSEELIKQYQRELELTLNATTDGIWKWNFITNEMEFSVSWYTMLGYEPNEFPTSFENWIALIHPDDRDRALSVATEYLKIKPDTYENEFRLRMKSGDYRWIQATGRVVERTPEGEALRIIGSHRDITENKQAEDALQRSEAQHKEAQKVAHLGHWNLNLDTMTPAWSDEIFRIFGFDPGTDEPSFANHEAITHPEDWPLLNNAIMVAVEKGNPFDIEFRIIRPDAELRWMRAIGHVNVDENGKSTEVFGTAQDITDLKETELSFIESENRFALAMDAAQDGLYDWNLETNEIYYSPGWKRMLGYGDNELPNDFSVWEKLTDPEDVKRSWKMQQDVINRIRDRFQIEFKMKHKDGHWIDVFSRASAIFDDSGKAIRMIGTHVDITERKQEAMKRKALETQLLQSQKMESIGRLAGGIAHDFNNILTSVTSNISLALMDMASNDPLRETFLEINTAVSRAVELTNQLLAFGRKRISDERIVDVNWVLDDVGKMIRRILGEDVDFQILPETDLGAVKMDYSHLEQILLNLAVNARDAMPDGGKLVISTKNVHLGKKDSDRFPNASSSDYIRLSVSDNGHGIDEQDLPNIYDPFFTTKPIGKGTGLGLSMVHGLVAQAKGFIDVDTSPGKGTTFNLYFPRINEKPESYERVHLKAPLSKGTETLLLVEDESSVMNIMKKILKPLGYTILKASNGLEALDISEKYADRIDLLITDIVMPGMNGRDLAEKLAVDRKEMKVLYISGYPREHISAEGKLKDGINFQEKPFTPAMLATRVRSILDGGEGRNR